MKKFTTIVLIMLITALSITQANAQNIVKSMKSGNWSDSTVWNTGTVPTANDRVIIVSPAQVVIDNNIMNCNGISINAGAILIAYNNGTTNISGDWDNSGIFTDNNSTIHFNGSTGQVISGKPTIFYNMIINDPNGVSLLVDASIKGELQLNNGKLITNGLNFTLLSDTNKTARIAVVNSLASGVAGNVTVQRYINNPKSTWRLFGSAVIGDSIGDLNNSFATYGFIGATYPNAMFNSVQYYDETVPGPNTNGYNYTLNASNILNNGLGYSCWIDSGVYVVSVTGQPAIGSQNFNITNTQTTDTISDGWNLIANPYASSIDWDSPNWNKAGLDNAVYVWNTNLQQYATYINGIGTNGGTNIIPSSEAFWVHASAINPVLNCTEDIKVSNNGTYLRTVAATSTLSNIIIDITGAGLKDEAVINFPSNASFGFNQNEDAIKMFSLNRNAPSINSIATNHDLAINSVPTNILNMDIPVRVKVGVSGTYSIKSILNMFIKPFTCIILEDLVTKAKIDLTTNTSYSFNISDTTKAPRFVLHLSSSPTGTITALRTIGIEPNDPYKTKGKGIAKVTKSNGSVTYTWRTSSGTVLASHTSNNDVDTLSNLPAGKYVVSVTGITSVCGITGPIVVDTLVINTNNERAIQNDTKNTDNVCKIRFIVYPNPNSGEFTVDISGLENSHDVTIMLRDEKGSNIYESVFNVQDESSVQRKIIPESKLTCGVYFCTLSSEGIKQTIKVIVN